MSLLTREKILTAPDLHTERVAVPEWGGDVLVKTMTGTERDAWETQLLDEDGKKNVRARMVAAVCVDETGALMFVPSDIEALGRKSTKALTRVFRAAARLNGLTVEEEKELG